MSLRRENSVLVEVADPRHEVRLHKTPDGVVRAWWYCDHVTSDWHVSGQQSAIPYNALAEMT